MNITRKVTNQMVIVVYLIIGNEITILFVSDNYVVNNDITNDTFIVVDIVISNNVYRVPMYMFPVSDNYVVHNIHLMWYI